MPVSNEETFFSLASFTPGAFTAGTAALLQRAEAYFQEGRRLFRAGQIDAARARFDAAIDVLLVGRPAGSDRDIGHKLAELAEAIHQFDVSEFCAGATSDLAFQGSPLEEIPEPTFPIDPKLRHQVAEQLKAAVSQLPLQLNDDVLRYINYFSSRRGRRTLLGGLSRAGRYRAMIHRIFDEEGIPRELIHLAQAESGFAPRAVSRKSASGMWQFMAWRGQEYGLLRTKTTDDRLDPEKATRAAARHLHDLYRQFGDWYLAMAAYNCGPLCVARAVERTGYADVWELRRRNALPRETSNYVPIILAMVIMSKNPVQYDLADVEVVPAVEFSTITTTAATDVQLIADITEKPIAAIRELNPALLTTIAPAGFPVHVPAGTGAAVLSGLELIPPDKRTTWRLYRVSEGDTADRIAQQFRTTAREIASANPEEAGLCAPGSLLVVPAPPKASRTQLAARKPVSARQRAVARTTTPAKPQAVARKTAPAKSPVTAKNKPVAASLTTAPAGKSAVPGSAPNLVASKRTAARASTVTR